MLKKIDLVYKQIKQKEDQDISTREQTLVEQNLDEQLNNEFNISNPSLNEKINKKIINLSRETKYDLYGFRNTFINKKIKEIRDYINNLINDEINYKYFKLFIFIIKLLYQEIENNIEKNDINFNDDKLKL